MTALSALAFSRTSPGFLRKALSPPSDPSTQGWMARNMVLERDVRAEAWRIFQVSTFLGASMLVALLVLAGAFEVLAGAVAAICLPFILASHVCNRPARMARRESRAYLRHAPAAIGSMAMSMSLSPSLERAVLFASTVNRNPLGSRLSLASWEVLTRSREDVESSLAAFASTLDHANQSLRQSLHLLLASVHEPTKDGMERLMEKSHEVSVQGLRYAAERYLASLSTPVMVLFALGILLPIMLLSMAPLLALTGPVPAQEGMEAPVARVPLAPISFMLLVVAPAISFLYSRSLLEGSPTATLPDLKLTITMREVVPWAIWAGALVALVLLGTALAAPQAFLLVLALPPALLLWKRKVGSARPKGGAQDPERDFIVGLYQVGNRLSTGASLEKALAEAASSSSGTEFAGWAKEMLHASRLSRDSISERMERPDITGRWPLLAEAFRTVARCAQGDGAAAGRVAVRLAKSLGDIKDCEQGIEERLRGVVDMMRSTSLVFAPIVLGVTVGLFGLTSSFAGAGDISEEVVLVAGVYLVELSLVVTYFTTFLSGAGRWGDVGRSFAWRMPVAVLLFTSISLLSRAGFARPW